jgi:hypothetical protein
VNDGVNTLLDDVLWTDAELQSVKMDYDDVGIALAESSGRQVSVNCSGFIGFHLCGFWDEAVIEEAVVVNDDPVIDACVHSIRTRYSGEVPETGNSERNRRKWFLLRIILSDGASIDIVAAGLKIRRLDES